MEILKSHSPIVVQLSYEDITLMHLAFYEYKDWVKKNKMMKKDKKRRRLREMSRLITLVDLLM